MESLISHLGAIETIQKTQQNFKQRENEKPAHLLSPNGALSWRDRYVSANSAAAPQEEDARPRD